jgi:hypothetical protein
LVGRLSGRRGIWWFGRRQRRNAVLLSGRVRLGGWVSVVDHR